MNRFGSLICVLFLSVSGFSQQVDTCTNFLEMGPSDLADDVDRSQVEGMADLLIELRTHPLNLNTADGAQLSVLPYLSDSEVEKIQHHRSRFGPFRSYMELHFLGITAEQMNCLQTVAYIEEAESTSPLELRTVVQSHLQSGSENVAVKNRLRLTATINRWSFGLHGEWDPTYKGGVIRPNYNTWINGYALYRPRDPAIIKQVVFGKFRIQSGQGISLHTGMGIRPGLPLTQMKHSGIRLAGSNSFYRPTELNGAAARIAFNRLTFMPFSSLRRLPIRLNNELPSHWISSGLEPSVHLSDSREWTSGLISQLALTKGTVGVNLIYRRFNQTFSPERHWYRVHRFQGRTNTQASVWAQQQIFNCYVYGEYSRQPSGSNWVIGGYRSMGRHATWFFQKRKRSPGTVDLHHSGYHRLSANVGEKGTLTGVEWRSHRSINYRLTVDRYHPLWVSTVNRNLSHRTDVRFSAQKKTHGSRLQGSIRLRSTQHLTRSGEFQKQIRLRQRTMTSTREYVQLEGQVAWLRGRSSALMVARLRRQLSERILVTSQIALGTATEVDLYYLDPVPLGQFGLNRVSGRHINAALTVRIQKDHTWIVYSRYRLTASPKFQLLLRCQLHWKA
jgi:hypothetical protein